MRKSVTGIFLMGLLISSCSGQPANMDKSKPVVAKMGSEKEGGVDPETFQKYMASLMGSSVQWKNLSRPDKIKAIKMILESFKQRENSAITKPADFYSIRMDGLLKENAEMQKLNLPTLVKFIAVMEYDFYNGQDKETLAHDLLGEQLFAVNKKRRQAAGLE